MPNVCGGECREGPVPDVALAKTVDACVPWTIILAPLDLFLLPVLVGNPSVRVDVPVGRPL
jgi:hypothetical protein